MSRGESNSETDTSSLIHKLQQEHLEESLADQIEVQNETKFFLFFRFTINWKFKKNTLVLLKT